IRILEHYGLIESLTETQQGYEGSCPICGSDAFKANTEKNAWFCFGECKEKEEKNGGNLLDLVASIEGVSVKKAAVLIAVSPTALFEPPMIALIGPLSRVVLLLRTG
ncbi:MAG: hypothetical protein GY916_07860, partial [Gammaproteobacteria bacterium]|nr:hypothetical protein [Gammaproteobacteria bacterium]